MTTTDKLLTYLRTIERTQSLAEAQREATLAIALLRNSGLEKEAAGKTGK